MRDDTVWSLTHDRCLFLHPDQRYDRHTGETNTIHGIGPWVGGRRDLFLRDGGKWTYCGIYECTGVSNESLEEVIHLIEPRSTVINTIIQRTCGPGIGGRELNTKIQSMYRSVQLFVRCYRLEKVNTNLDIENALSTRRHGYNGKLELLGPQRVPDEVQNENQKRPRLS